MLVTYNWWKKFFNTRKG